MASAYCITYSYSPDSLSKVMTGNTEHDDGTVATIESDAPFDGRYASVAVDHEETIIYDREVEEAWIQADNVLSLTEAE
jgi:hypothetical protein